VAVGLEPFREAEPPRAQAVAAAAVPLAATRLPDAAAALLQARAHQLSLLVAALEALPSPAQPPGGAAEPAAAQAAAAQGAEPPGAALAPLDAALAVPALAPPGAETLALRALSCALRPGPPLAALRRAGAAALAAFAAGGSGVAAAAGCSGALAAADGPDVRARRALTRLPANTRRRQRPVSCFARRGPLTHPYPTSRAMLKPGLPGAGQERAPGAVYALPRVPAAVALRRALLEGYAAAWLGLVPEQAPRVAGAGAARGGAAPAVLQPVGSRLPAPPVRQPPGARPQRPRGVHSGARTHGAERVCLHRAAVLPGPGGRRSQLRCCVLAH